MLALAAKQRNSLTAGEAITAWDFAMGAAVTVSSLSFGCGLSTESLKTRFLPLNWAQSTHPQKQASAGLVLLGTLGKWWVRWQPQITFRPPTSMMQSQGEEGDD